MKHAYIFLLFYCFAHIHSADRLTHINKQLNFSPVESNEKKIYRKILMAFIENIGMEKSAYTKEILALFDQKEHITPEFFLALREKLIQKRVER